MSRGSSSVSVLVVGFLVAITLLLLLAVLPVADAADYYSVLGVGRSSSIEEIKKGFCS